jgi:hypothetical protein
MWACFNFLWHSQNVLTLNNRILCLPTIFQVLITIDDLFNVIAHNFLNKVIKQIKFHSTKTRQNATVCIGIIELHGLVRFFHSMAYCEASR